MKHSSKILLTAFALLAVTLGVSSTNARRGAGPELQDRSVSIRVPDNALPKSFSAQMRGDDVVGMTAIKKDGSRVALKAQSKPTCATSCPAGQVLTCWEDEQQLMSMCVCVTPGSGGSGTLATLHSDTRSPF
jgi:hypothetical protein